MAGMAGVVGGEHHEGPDRNRAQEIHQLMDRKDEDCYISRIGYPKPNHIRHARTSSKDI